MQQKISSNATLDTVTTSYERTDGALIDHTIDFKNVSALLFFLKRIFIKFTERIWNIFDNINI